MDPTPTEQVAAPGGGEGAVTTNAVEDVEDAAADDDSLGAFDGMDEDYEDGIPEWKRNPSFKTRSNTPPPRGKRAATSAVWVDVKRLDGDHPMTLVSKGWTHICTICARLFVLKHNSSGGGWLSAGAGAHLKSNHPESKFAVEAQKNSDVATSSKQSSLFAAGFSAGISSGGSGGKRRSTSDNLPSSMRLSPEDKALTAQARWYVYSAQHISKRGFEDDYFIRMIKAANLAGGDRDTPVLTTYKLKQYVRAEFNCFLFCLVLICGEKWRESHGFPCMQLVHDGATLKNKKKYQAFALQFIQATWAMNVVVCFGFLYSAVNDAGTVAGLLKSTFEARTKLQYDGAVALVKSDRAAISVAGAAGTTETETTGVGEGCDMHDIDKVGASALGVLLRSKNGAVVNPFVGGKAILEHVHDVGVHFSRAQTRQQLLMDAANTVQAPNIRIKVDLNSTRIAAGHMLFVSALRLNRAIKVYSAQQSVDFGISNDDWATIAEFEAILRITQVLTQLSQVETHFLAGYSYLMKKVTYKRLLANEISVVDLDAVEQDPRMPRSEKNVSQFTATGHMCLFRAILEFERRFCGNKTETRLAGGGEIEVENRILLATLLDLRLKEANHLSQRQVIAAVNDLKALYVAFYCQWHKFEREERRKAKKAAAAAAAAAAALRASEAAAGAATTGAGQVLLPHLASCSKGEIGALNAESYAERVISAANLVLTEGNTLLSDKELEMLVILRMNRRFMEFMRIQYKQEIIDGHQPMNCTPVRLYEEDGDEEEGGGKKRGKKAKAAGMGGA